MRTIRFAGLLLLAVLGGCISYTLVPGGKVAKVGDVVTVLPGQDWNRSSSGHVEVWTLDGPGLQQILFVEGAKDGDYLFPVRGGRGNLLDDLPRFTKGMSALEVADLYEATLTRAGAAEFTMHDLQPYKVGERNGFRFDFDCLSKDGLQLRGAAIGIVKDDRVYMAVYTGTRIHFFDKGWQDVQHIFETFRVS